MIFFCSNGPIDVESLEPVGKKPGKKRDDFVGVFETISSLLHTAPSANEAKASAKDAPSTMLYDHCYSLPPENQPAEKPPRPLTSIENRPLLDHDYLVGQHTDSVDLAINSVLEADAVKTDTKARARKKTVKETKPPVRQKKLFVQRNQFEEWRNFYEFLNTGVDGEDVHYLKRSYEEMAGGDLEPDWISYTVWVEHCSTYVPTPAPPKRRRRGDELKAKLRQHSTGSARTEGTYKPSAQEKAIYMYQSKQAMQAYMLGQQNPTKVSCLGSYFCLGCSFLVI